MPAERPMILALWSAPPSRSTAFAQTLPRQSPVVEESPLLAGYPEYPLPFYESRWQHRIRLDERVPDSLSRERR